MMLAALMLAAAPPAPVPLLTSAPIEVVAEVIAGANGVGTTGGVSFGARATWVHLSLGGRCAIANGSFVFFTPVGGEEERGSRVSCLADVGPSLPIGPVVTRVAFSVGAALEQVDTNSAALLVAGVGAGASLPIGGAMSIIADARIENALGPKGLGGGLVVGVGLAISLD